MLTPYIKCIFKTHKIKSFLPFSNKKIIKFAVTSVFPYLHRPFHGFKVIPCVIRITIDTADYQHGWQSSWMTIGMADYWHRWLPSGHRQEHRHKLLTYQTPARMATGTDDHLQDIDTADYQHRWLSSWMATGMAPVTIGIDGYLHGSCNHQHGELSAWRTTGIDGHLQNIDRSIDTSCRLTRHQHGWLPA